MATRRPKKDSFESNDFAAALSAWEKENPAALEGATEKKKGSPKPAEGPLAAQLRERFGVEGPNREQRRKGKRAAGTSTKVEAAKTTPAQTTERALDGKRQLTADELMQEAFEAVGEPGHDPTAKYTGRGYAKALEVEVLDETAAGIVDEAKERYEPIDGHTREDVEFLQLMASADVKPLDHKLDKLRTALDSRTKWQKEPALQIKPDPLSKDELDAPTLTGAQRDILRRARKQTLVPTLNLRHNLKYEALQRLHVFVLKEQQNHTRFVRVITGKGKQSKEGMPVIKPMVIEWCELEPGRSLVLGYAPETDQTGNYGVLILELRRM